MSGRVARVRRGGDGATCIGDGGEGTAAGPACAPRERRSRGLCVTHPLRYLERVVGLSRRITEQESS